MKTIVIFKVTSIRAQVITFERRWIVPEQDKVRKNADEDSLFKSNIKSLVIFKKRLGCPP